MYARYLHNETHGEDVILVDGPLFVVLDGVSTSNGKVAATTTAKYLKGSRSETEIREALKKANEELGPQKAQTTVAGVLVKEGAAYVFGVGDSPAVHVTMSISRILPLDSGDKPEYVTQIIGDGAFQLHERTIPAMGHVLLMSDGVSDNLSMQDLQSVTRGAPSTIAKRVKSLLESREKENQGFVYKEFKDDDRALIVLHLDP